MLLPGLGLLDPNDAAAAAAPGAAAATAAAAAAAAAAGNSSKDTLVAYIFSATDPQYLQNMEFFIRAAIGRDDRCDYVFVLQVSG